MTKKKNLTPKQSQALEELETFIGKSIPSVEEIKDETFGVKIFNGSAVGLGLYRNKLTTLPESIGNLESLQMLDLSNNKLTTLPDSITNLKLLLFLDLSYNQLSTLPESIGNLTSIKYLKLSYNQLSTIPESLTKLKSLQMLDLSNNKLTTLKEPITKLKSLFSLELSHNQLSTLPDSITKLTSLQTLDLSRNQLTTLPDSISKLTSLQTLKLGENQLSTLPRSISKLTSLQTLELSMNQLTTLPDSITKLSSLQKLELGMNQLKTLPDSITKLSSLQILKLGGNKLSALPEPITKLKSLKKLELRDNRWKGEWIDIEHLENVQKKFKLCRKLNRESRRLKNTNQIHDIEENKENFEEVNSNNKIKISEYKSDRKLTQMGHTRMDLKNLIKRFYFLLGFHVEEDDGLMRVFTDVQGKLKYSYVFNKKDIQRYKKAELITYNSEKLINIINSIIEKGKVAKAYIPFEYDDNLTFNSALNNLLNEFKQEDNQNDNNTDNLEKKNQKFIQNGNIISKGLSFGYLPFLIFILKLQFSSIESFSKVEKLGVPLFKMENTTLLTNITYYKEKIKDYFNMSKPVLAIKMPVKGAIIEVSDELLKNSLQDSISEIEESIEIHKNRIENQANEAKDKELGIINNYYEQRHLELDHRIELAGDRGDTKSLDDFEKQKRIISQESEFKLNELDQIYKVRANHEVLGAALVYAASNSSYKCDISTPYGVIEKDFGFDIFEKKIIPPTCSCGSPIYSGIICENKHLSCLDCIDKCSECGKVLCNSCKIEFCKICSKILCKEHQYECEKCKKINKKDCIVCKEHQNRCHNCSKTICLNCSKTCYICGKTTCTNHKLELFKCSNCKKIVCKEHSFNCNEDLSNICMKYRKECSSCHGNYCYLHQTSNSRCSACSEMSSHKFYEFYNENILKFKLPLITGIKENNQSYLYESSRGVIKTIPYHLKNVKMGENKSFCIFQLKKLTGTFIIVHKRKTNEQILYFKKSLIGNLFQTQKKKNIPSEIILKEPAIIFKEHKINKRKN